MVNIIDSITLSFSVFVLLYNAYKSDVYAYRFHGCCIEQLHVSVKLQHKLTTNDNNVRAHLCPNKFSYQKNSVYNWRARKVTQNFI